MYRRTEAGLKNEGRRQILKLFPTKNKVLHSSLKRAIELFEDLLELQAFRECFKKYMGTHRTSCSSRDRCADSQRDDGRCSCPNFGCGRGAANCLMHCM